MRKFILSKQLDILFLLAKFARFLIRGDRLHSPFYRRMASHINRFVMDKNNMLLLGEDTELDIKRIDISLYIVNTTRIVTEYLLRNPRRGL